MRIRTSKSKQKGVTFSGVSAPTPPTFLGASATSSYTSLASRTCPLVACAVGDVRFVIITGNGVGVGGTQIASADSGWAALNAPLAYGSGNVNTLVMWKQKQNGDNDADVAYTLGGAINHSVRSVAYGNCKVTGSPIGNYAWATGGSVNSVQPPSIVCTGQQSWVIYEGGLFSSSWATSQTGYVVDSTLNQGNGSHQASHILQVAPGTVTPGVLSCPSTGAVCVLALELKGR